ncbi:formate-nitrite transporter [Plasmodium falciparum NF54]|uniref:Formate-nitrite transporter n=5 Tax=Plasmodium falciparum TaxID=5833 RepID=FNT_PLAF7|nr:formate-nitrite transporter [Plasmodium falciparum 3D7]6VQQ_A Chain A, Formate-nitrite transporter [Plasmodium falciparum 3D7]6VQQ_B Chain B, Formate-nitrite transporter [Plasmodium falciparum 3D7]6VQQ_C Chain C, Formate-nitrite transporter [Plasmodium falciparum 3D7]6VQQ_D Chain D, Formate-nitrite transporter [Plasmodium falciparum 3D7]6VQQ_E Chain E, Formate-nitrite transporter [Plasmodium falciparum 3D7]6VQR_A Chain A, Formate-nitrite transporter [Plasmodium falciparum 3D7]6VQR_B Chain|eukprot:XP_001351236.1 formate-nitrite transporter [Plasmodium falciparum 3D7]
MPPNNSKYVLDPVSIKSVCGGEESYIRCVEYGKKKAHYSNLNLLAKAILAGMFVGLCAHASGIAGGLFYYHKLREIVGASMSVFVYGFTFPIAFMCIICTGSDLFTGNTLAVTMALYEKKVKLLDYLRVMTISLFGNYVGAVSFAFFVSYLSGAFTNVHAVEKNHFFQFLNDIAEKKVHHTFVECVSLAVGCNIFVCLAVYFVLTLKDGAGYVFSVFFAVYAFAIAGYEHIIANIYTLNIALMVNTKITVYQAYIKNLLPTLLGNYIAGAIVLGLPLYFIYKEHYYNFERSKRDNNDAQMKSLSIELRN